MLVGVRQVGIRLPTAPKRSGSTNGPSYCDPGRGDGPRHAVSHSSWIVCSPPAVTLSRTGVGAPPPAEVYRSDCATATARMTSSAIP
jgi:hypothetical protein